MEEKLYNILKKHKLSLKKREDLIVDLLNLIKQSENVERTNSDVCANCGLKEKQMICIDCIEIIFQRIVNENK